MDDQAIRLVIRDYDYLAPLYGGDVVPDGLNLIIDRKTPMAQAYGDPSVEASELSLSRFLIGLSNHDRPFVGIPFFPMRAFRHRCFFVRRDRTFPGLKQLEGMRVGTNGWPDTGNTWTRAALREQGILIERIRWWVGRVDEDYPESPQGALPPFARVAPRMLREMLLDGDLDALMCPSPPKGFYDPRSPIIRLFPDYRTPEREYYLRTGIFPAHHVIGLRREVFEHEPQIAVAIYQALERARLLWQQRRLQMGELTPWILAEIEDARALFGADWQPGGVAVNRAMIQALCEEEHAQGLIDRPLDPDTVFQEFDTVLKT